jgi:hypothetical protein
MRRGSYKRTTLVRYAGFLGRRITLQPASSGHCTAVGRRLASHVIFM